MNLSARDSFYKKRYKTSNPYNWNSFTRSYLTHSEGSFFLTVPKRNIPHAQAFFGFSEWGMASDQSAAGTDHRATRSASDKMADTGMGGIRGLRPQPALAAAACKRTRAQKRLEGGAAGGEKRGI